MAIEVRDFVATDHEWARELLAEDGNGDHRVERLGELLDPLEHAGLVADRGGDRVGLLTVLESDAGMEVTTLCSAPQGIGAGTALLATVIDVAVASRADRLWTVVGSENAPTTGWYLRRGLHVRRVHDGAVELEADPRLGLVRHGFPLVADLDALPGTTAAALLGPLFEHAPRFLGRLVERRPFGDDAGLIGMARDLARELPEDEAIELLDAHPRIGADPSSVSALSHAEQGYDEPEAVEPWIADDLQMLNDAYERIFGFRFVIFVAGRPRSAIVPILEASLRDDRTAELRRGLDDVVHIAADRLATLRTASI